MKYPTEEQNQDVRTRWFKNHKATILHDGETLKLIEWKDPESWCYAIRYIIDRNTLCVWGDLGEAVYQWGDRINLAFLANIELGYFVSKCQASEKGRGRDCYSFDFDDFAKGVREYVKECEDDGFPSEIDLDSLTYSEDEHGAISYLNDQSIEGETIGMLLDTGKSLNLRIASHLIGLKMAHAQLTAVIQQA